MPSVGVGGSDQAVHAGIVVTLTALWWACAVGVTVVLKVALGSGSSVVPGVWSFPFPLTLTLLSTIGTALSCGLLVSLAVRQGLDDDQHDDAAATATQDPAERQPHGTGPPTPRSMMRASPREAFVDSTAVSPDPTAAASALARGEYAGCPGGGAFTSCGCFSRRRKRGSLVQSAPLELEFVEPELLLVPLQEEYSKAAAAAGGSTPQRSLDYPGGPAASSAGRPPGDTTTSSALVGAARSRLLTEQNVSLVTMGLIQGLALGAKNEALLLLSVSTRTMLFATNVLVVMLVARLFGLEKLRRTKLIAALILASGGMLQGLATWRKMRGEGADHADAPLGYLLAILALVLDAMRWVLLQAVFAHGTAASGSLAAGADTASLEQGLDTKSSDGSGEERAPPKAPLTVVLLKAVPVSKLRMIAWVAWTTAPVCLGLSVLFEPRGLVRASQHPMSVFGLVALLTLGVMGINIAEFGIVQWTSAVTFNVLSQLHGIPLILAGVTCFGERIAPVQVLGFAICLSGAMLYSVVKAQEKRISQAQAAQAGQSAQADAEGHEQAGAGVEAPFLSLRRDGELLGHRGLA